MNILFLGKYDKSMHLLEEEILNIPKNTSPNQTHKLELNEPAEPDVKKYPIDNCDVWVILGNVKPTLLLKQLISQANILLFIFNFTNLETLAFLTEGWGPIVKKAGIPKPENQKRILIGTQCNSSINSKDIINKIKDAMKNLGCEEYYGHGIRIKNEKIGPYTIIHDLITYIKEQIQEKQPESSILDESNESNKTIGDNIKNEYLDNKQKEELADEKNQTKIEIELENNVLMNLILKENTAEILNVQNASNNFIVPHSVPYKNKEYIITNICDSAFKDSNIVRLSFVKESQVKRIGNYAFQRSKIQCLSIPASLEILGEFWCAEANNLSTIYVDKNNHYFKNIDGYLIKNQTEILFAPNNYMSNFKIPYYNFFNNQVKIGNYAFYGTNNLQNINISLQEIYIGDFCFSNSKNLKSIEITCTNKLKIGKNCFENCGSLSSVSINNEGVDDLTISKDFFYNCKSLVKLTIHSKSKLILENEIILCNDKLEEVNLKGSLVIIGDKCFKDSFTKEKYQYYYSHRQYSINRFLKIESESYIEFGKNCFEGSNIDKFEISGKEIYFKEESFSKCSFLTYFEVLDAIKICIDEFSFKDCDKLNEISLTKIGFVIIRPKAFIGCTKLLNFNFNFESIYDAWNDFDIKKDLQKTGGSSKLFVLQKKGTKELFMFKQLLHENKIEDHIKFLSENIILFSKDNDLILSDICGCGLIKLNSKSEEYLAIMTRYYNNGSLYDVFTKNITLSDTKKYILILGITYEMMFLHSNRLSYPNLPPEKILLDENFYPHLNVIGYSNQLEPTIYTAPEVLIENKYFYESDVYSYSLIIYELITGKKPYNTFQSIKEINIQKGYRPDIKCIKNENHQKFLKRCWSDIYSRPNFKEIYNEIINERFIHSFNVNEEEVYNYMKLLNIPETVELNGISYNLFKWSKTAKITKVDMLINNFQFQKFYEREKIKYNVIEICDKAFSNCYNLTKITFPKGSNLLRIGNFAFEYSNLTHIEIDTDQNITIQADVFKNCSYLKNVIVRSSQSLILLNNCFCCSNIELFEAVGNQVEICDDCFSSSENLHSLKITSKEKLKIGQNIFDNCKSLSSFTIQNESNEDLIISANSFKNFISLSSIEIHNNKSKLIFEKEIFSLSNNLKNVLISGNQIVFGEKSFYKSFNTINAKMMVEFQTSIEFEHQSFGECNIEMIQIKSKEFHIGEVHIGEESFVKCLKLNKFVNNSLEVFIEKYAFKDCSNLALISFGEIGYFKISMNALFGCFNLKTIQLNLTQPFKSSKYYQSEKKPVNMKSSRIYFFNKLETNEQYIAKVFTKRKSEECQKYLDYFLNQIVKLSEENNPTLPQVFECGMFRFSKKSIFTVISKYFTKLSLDYAINKKELSGTHKYIILLGIAIGMKYIESRKIDHQVLTTKKILLDESYYPHLNNFDIKDISDDIKKDVSSFSSIFHQLMINLNTTDNSNNQVQINPTNERIHNFLKKCSSSDPNKRPTFSEIVDEITNFDYLNYFHADNEKINEYLDLFKIELKDKIEYNDLQCILFRRSKTAKIKVFQNCNFHDILGLGLNGCLLKYLEINIDQKLIISTKDFYDCDSLTDLKLKAISVTLSYKYPMKVETFEAIGNQVNLDGACFYSSKKLISLKIEGYELNVGSSCFSDCINLTTVSFNSLKKIKLRSFAFRNCLKLNNIEQNNSQIKTLEIGNYCFQSCKMLSKINFGFIQNGKIGSSAFEKCESITEFILNAELNLEIGDYCFYMAIKLSKVDLSANSLKLGQSIFYQCPINPTISKDHKSIRSNENIKIIPK